MEIPESGDTSWDVYEHIMYMSFLKASLFFITQIYTFSLIIKTFKLYIGLESRVFEQLWSRPVLLRPVTVRT